MADVTDIGLIVGTSTFVNVVYAVQHNRSAVVSLVAGGMSFVALSLIGSFTGRMDVARGIALLFLLSAIIIHGTKIKLGVSALGKPTKK